MGGWFGLYISSVARINRRPKLRVGRAILRYSQEALSNAFSWSREINAAPNFTRGGSED